MSEVQQQDVTPGAPPAPPATATEASARLTALGADKAWAQRLFSGDIAAQKEFDRLNVMVAEGGDRIDRAMSGVLPDLPDADLKHMAGLTEFLRDAGCSDGVIREALSGREVTKAEFDATKRWHDQHMRDQDFTKKWLSGDPEAARLMTLAHLILSSEIRAAA